MEEKMRAWLKEQGIEVGCILETLIGVGNAETEIKKVAAIEEYHGYALVLKDENECLIDVVCENSDTGEFYLTYKGKVVTKEENNGLTLTEVIATIKCGETYVCTNPDLFAIQKITGGMETVSFYSEEGAEVVHVNTKARFKLEKKPVTFQEAITSSKRIRVEHPCLVDSYTYDITCKEYVVEEACEKHISGEYICVDDMFSVIGWLASPDEVADVINNGKWYIED